MAGERRDVAGVVDPVLLATIEAAKARGARSPLRAWLAENHDALLAVLEQYGANWRRLSRVWVERGLIPRPDDWDVPGEAGERARERVANTAKQTWKRVRAERKAMAAKAAPPRLRVAPVATIAPPEPRLALPPAEAVAAEADRTGEAEPEAPAPRQRTFGTARPRGWTPGGGSAGGG